MLPDRAVPIIERQETWGASWEEAPELRIADRLELGVGTNVNDQVVLAHTYGPAVKRVDQLAVSAEEPVSYINNWIRIKEPLTKEVLWQGIIKADRRKIFRDSEAPHGRQRLVALGPITQLRRIVVNTSFWWNSTYSRYYELAWVPSINERGASGLLQGTKGDNGPGAPYGYGVDSSDAIWTFEEYIEYLLYFHVQQTGGPIWVLEDLSGTLTSRVDVVRMRSTQTALTILRQLVRPSDGIEFAIVPIDTGYKIRVFAIAKDAITFGTATLPRNTDTMTVNPTTDPLIVECEAEISEMQTCDTLEVQGERIESCFTIAAAEKEALWTSTDESAYKSGSTQGSATTAEHDLARGDDRFRLVYQGFAAPSDWDWNSGLATVVLDQYGDYYSTNAERQNVIRKTLARLPLKEGGVYTGATPNEADATNDFVPPIAIGYVSADRGYAVLDKLSHADLESDDDLIVASASIRILENEWGVIIEFPANYMHANNHWAAGSPADTGAYGITDPDAECIDYDDTLFTIAAPTDQRLKCYKDRTSPARDGSKAVIEVPGARFQWIEGSAAIGVDTDGTVKYSPSNGVILRNDNEALHIVMAGAIARYLSERFAFDVIWQAAVPTPDYLGRILIMGSGEGDLAGRWGLVTSIWFDFDSGTSGMRAGYA